MPNRMKRLAKGLMVGSLFVVYQMPGCNLTIDDAMLQAFFDTLGSSGEVSFEFEYENGGNSGDFDHSGGDVESDED